MAIWMSLALLGVSLALPQAAPTSPKAPQWFLDHMSYMTKGSGRWIADNAKYRSENEPFDAYGTEWRWAAGRRSITGRLFGMRDGAEQRTFWEFRVFWHAGDKKAYIHQFGGNGAVSIGTMEQAGPKHLRMKQKSVSPRGRVSWLGHDTKDVSETEQTTQSYDIEGEVWKKRRFYRWKLVGETRATQKSRGVWTDPAAAARDDVGFGLQGEYARHGVGLQVIALGADRFRLVKYAGGLPALGWDGKGRTRVETDAGGVRKEIADRMQRVQRSSPTLGAKSPKGAVVLFDGTRRSLANWKKGARISSDGFLMEGATSLYRYQNARIHVEFRLPYEPAARGQKRGNSGLYVQGRYETQMLDSFGLQGRHNECGGIYSVRAPDVNACLPPLRWQTYDIDFTAAEFDADGKKAKNARMTVRLNGIVVHENVEVPKRTTASPLKEGPEPGPLYLQNHRNPVRYRNVWVLPKKR